MQPHLPPVTVEDPAQSVARLLDNLLGEIRRLEGIYLRRRQQPEALPPGPDSQYSVQGYIVRRAIDRGVSPTCGQALLDWLYRKLVPYRDRLQAYARRRTGQWDPSRHSQAEWNLWEAKEQEEYQGPAKQLPHATGPCRLWARELLEARKSYRETLTGVAYMWMVRSGRLLDRKEALKVRRAVDREFQYYCREVLPSPPRGWWRPTKKRIAGGANIVTVAWDPSITMSQSNGLGDGASVQSGNNGPQGKRQEE